jgi:hypothetical protein
VEGIAHDGDVGGWTMSGAENWQFVDASTDLQRIRVPGGWIYRDTARDAVGKALSTSICFVPLPKDPTDAR